MRSGAQLCLIAMTIFCAHAIAYDWSANPGDGSPENPYQISTPEHLTSIGSDPVLLTKNYILTNDIVLDPTNNPAHVFVDAVIAPDPDNDKIPAFRGFFDGNSRQIINLKVIGTNRNVGLFGVLIGTGTEQIIIRDLTLINPQTSGGQAYCGVLAGRMEGGSIENCHIAGGSVNHPAGSLVGGLIGAMDYAAAVNCSSSAQVTGHYNVAGFAGGIGASAIISSSASGHVTGDLFVGGLVAWMWKGYTSTLQSAGDRIIDCHATGNVTSAGERCGGLVAYTCKGDFQNCYASGNVTGTSRVGGLMGFVEKENPNVTPLTSGPTTIVRCYASGHVIGTGSVGGLIGKNEAILV